MSRSGGLTGPVGGIINNAGKLTATASFTSSGNFIISGQVVTTAGRAFGVLFVYSWLGQQYTGTFSETSTSSGSSGSGAGA